MHTGDTREEGLDGRARELGLVGSGPAKFDSDRAQSGYDCRSSVLELVRDSHTTYRGAAEDRTFRRLLGPPRRRSVRRLLAGSLISKTGDWLTVGELMGWVYQDTRSTRNVALLMLVRLAPPILSGAAVTLLIRAHRRPKSGRPSGGILHALQEYIASVCARGCFHVGTY